MGSLDADGYIRISGRKKDLIIRSGHNIEPRVIEEALLHSPAVALAAAVGKPDAHAGELPVAYVQLHPGAQATEAELLEVAARHIHERPAVPKEIVILDQIPLTAVGKPQKHLLQVDAAQRTFQALFEHIAGDWKLEVGLSGGGLMISVQVPKTDPACRKQIEQILSGFAVRHQLSEA